MTPRFPILAAACASALALAATVTILGCSPAPKPPAAKPAATADIPTIAFEKYTLANGLEVILSEDHRLPLVAVNLWYHVGPANEEPGRTGFAHLFEHMMFQGSKHVPGRLALPSSSKAPARATSTAPPTSTAPTTSRRCPSNQLELALWLESDRMGYLLDKLDQANLSNQQDVVRNERRQSVENQPYGIVAGGAVPPAVPEGRIRITRRHRLARGHPGREARRRARTSSSSTTRRTTRASPSSATSTRPRREALVEKYFGTLKRGTDGADDRRRTTPPITAERRAVVTDRVELPRVYMAWMTLADLQAGRRRRRHRRAHPRRRQVEPPVQEAGLRTADRAGRAARQQYSLMLGSVFTIEATARPGHTAEELEKAIDSGARGASRADGPTHGRSRARAQRRSRRRSCSGLETLGGFGGVADRLNSYNHYLRQPRLPAAGHRPLPRRHAATRAGVRAATQLAADQPRRRARRARRTPELRPRRPDAEGGSGGARAGAESINADEPWRERAAEGRPGHARCRSPRRSRSRSAERPDRDPQPSGRGCRSCRPISCSGPAATPTRPTSRGSPTSPRRCSTRARPRATRCRSPTTVAQLGASLDTSSSMDAIVGRRRRRSRKNFPATLDLLADVALRPSFPAEEVERQRAQPPRAARPAARRTRRRSRAPRWPLRCTARRTRTATPRLGTEAVDQGDHARRHVARSGSRTSCRTTPRSSSPGRSPMAELKAAGREGVRRRGRAARPPRRGSARRRRPRARLVHRGQAGRAADAVARRARSARRASTPDYAALAGDEHGARRPVLEPHQPEPARGSTATPTAPGRASRSSALPGAVLRGAPACRPT